MKKRLTKIQFVFVAFTIVFTCLSCENQTQNKSNQLNDGPNVVKNVTGDEISNLETGKYVRFPAVLVTRIGSNCVELFTPDEFMKYNGDGKRAIMSKLRLRNKSNLTDSMFANKSVIVTGTIAAAKDSQDTSETCGIVTGSIFEIIEIEEFNND